MRRKILQLVSVFMCMTLFLVNVTTTNVYAEDSKVSVRVEVNYGQTEARTMLSLINGFRTGSDAWEWNADDKTKTVHTDLLPLEYDYALEKIAMQRAAEIALSYSHTRPNDSDCFTAYGSYSWMACGENIAAGYGSAEAVFIGWQETDKDYAGQGHRRNMLSEKFNAIGIGHAYYNGTHYWVQEFAKTSSVNDSATSAADGTETAAIEVSTSYISNVSLSCNKSEISLKAGETSELPEVSLTANFKDHWPTGKDCSNITIGDGVQWSSSDEKIAIVTGNNIEAKAGGNAVLKAQVMNVSTEVKIIVESDEPEQPENPSEPEEPTTPENPSEPEEPTTPENPSEPEEPTTPENPGEPEEPTTPENPSQPEKPSEPERPAEEPTSSTDSSSNASSSSVPQTTAAAPKVVQPSYVTKDNRKVSGWQEVMDVAYLDAQSDRASLGNALPGRCNIDINITSVTDLAIPKGTVASMKQKDADYNFYYKNIAITITHEALAEWTEDLDLKVYLDTKKNFGGDFDAFCITKHADRAIPENSMINILLSADKAGNYAYIFGRNTQGQNELLSAVPISAYGTIMIPAGIYKEYIILY